MVFSVTLRLCVLILVRDRRYWDIVPHRSEAIAETSSSVVAGHPATGTSRRWPDIEPAALLRGQYQYHWTIFGLSALVLALAVLLGVRGETQVTLPIVGAALPELCYSRSILGLDCPGCGLTRSFISLAHGQPYKAWQFNPAGIFLFAAIAFQLPYRAVQLMRLRLGRPEINSTVFSICGLAVLASLFVQWVWRMLA